MVFEERCILK